MALRFDEVVLTARADVGFVSNGSAVFGWKGNDQIGSSPFGDIGLAVGGSGADQ